MSGLPTIAPLTEHEFRVLRVLDRAAEPWSTLRHVAVSADLGETQTLEALSGLEDRELVVRADRELALGEGEGDVWGPSTLAEMTLKLLASSSCPVCDGSGVGCCEFGADPRRGEA